MTQEDKELLLKDLCCRLPYGVKVHRTLYGAIELNERQIESFRKGIDDMLIPYLRPMSSMTGEEKAEYHHLCESIWDADAERMFHYDTYKSIDYLNSICVDYRGLIKNGLAIEATKGMYSI